MICRENAKATQLVHEGVLAHAIWTVSVASLLVVADHHHLRHRLLEME